MKIYPFKASYPKGELITSPKSFFSSIKHQYREYKQNNFYKELGKESLFVYRIKNGDRSHVGILTLTDVKEMSKRNVMKHEKTLAAKEQQMMHLIIQRNALVKPVLLGYKSNSQIKKIVHAVTKEKPLLNIPFKAEDELLYQLGHSTLEYDREDDTHHTREVDFIFVWKKNEQGFYRIYVDTYN